MPQNFESTEVSSHEDFTLTTRAKQQGEMQASETLRITSTGDRPLGEGGELGGVAKRELEDFRGILEARKVEYTNLAETRLQEIRQDYQKQFDTQPPLPENERARLQNRLNSVDRLLTPGQNQMDLSGFARGLPEHQHDPMLTQLEETQRMLRGGWNNVVGTVQPLVEQQLVGVTAGDADTSTLHLLSRAVASSKVDQLLGTSSLALEKFGVDQNGKPIGISVMVDGVGTIGNLDNGKSYFLEVDYASHAIQKGLYDLEMLDYITGQIDRHPGNIFIDPETGTVKGIDNDLAFPQMSREMMMANNGGCYGKPVQNKPLFVHEDTARKIESLRPEDLRRTLESVHYPNDPERGRLAPQEIEGAVQRLQEMKEHVRELRKTGHVVREFNHETFDEAVTHQEESYARERGEELNLSNDVQTMGMCGKTSYVGSIAIERRKNEIALREGNGERLDFEGVKAANNSTGKAQRSPEHAEFAKQTERRRQELKNEIAPGHEAEKEQLKARLDYCEGRLAKLERPSFMDKIKALRYGGIEGAKTAFNEKRIEALQNARGLEQRMDQEAGQRLEGEKPQIWNNVKQKIDSERVGQSQRQSQVLKTEVSESVSEPKLEGLSLDENNPKPSLERQGSVRDLMREKGVVQKAKEELSQKLDLGEDNTTRKNVKLQGTDGDQKPDVGTKVK